MCLKLLLHLVEKGLPLWSLKKTYIQSSFSHTSLFNKYIITNLAASTLTTTLTKATINLFLNENYSIP